MSSTLEDIRRGVQRKLAGETIWGDIYTTVNGDIAAATTTVTLPTTFKSTFITDNHFQGWYFYICDNNADSDGTPPGTCIRIVSYDASAGTIVLDEALSESGAHNCLDDGCEVEITPYHPKFVERCINDFLLDTYYPTEWAISLANIENNDFEHATVSTGWTTSNSTLAAETTAVFRGGASGKVTTNAANGYIVTAAIPVVDQEVFRIWAPCKCTTGDTAKLIVYDDTNAAAATLGGTTYISAQELRWQLLSDEFTVPDACESVTIRLQGVGNGDIIYWDDLQLVSARRTEYKLPSWITEEFQVQDVVVYKGAGQLSGDSYNYMPDEGQPIRYPHWKLIRDGSTFRLKVQPSFGAGRPRLRALRPCAELATSSATTPTGGTTTCDLRYAVQGGFVMALERLAFPAPGEEREQYKNWYLKEKSKLDGMTYHYQPWAREPKRDVQGETLFGLSEAT